MSTILGPDATDESFLLSGSAMVRSKQTRARCELIVYWGGPPSP